MTTPRNFPRMAGVRSGPRILLPRASPRNNARRRGLVTFYANTTWTAPQALPLIYRLIGKGANGTPATGTSDLHVGYRTYRTQYSKFQSDPSYTNDGESDQGWTEGFPAPADFCSSPAQTGTVLYFYCYRHVREDHDEGNYVPEASGAAATAFGKVFAGGPSAQPAQSTQYFNTPVVAGTEYSIVVPAGGYITIEY